jgi:nicotinamidase-related amidase
VPDPDLSLVPATTALVLVDLQAFTVALPTRPLAGHDVLTAAGGLADAVRAAGGLVVHVVASLGRDGGRALIQPVADVAPPALQLPAGWDAIPPELGPAPQDVIVTKWGWDGFHGTDLDLQLRRRGITTLLVGGIASDMGVESTARHAHEYGYEQVFVREVLSAFDPAAHAAALDVLGRIGRVRVSADVVAALGVTVAAGATP